MRIHFLIPGDPDTLTGCKIYNKRIIEGLRGKGHDVKLYRLADDFPFPDEESVNYCLQVVRTIPPNEPVLIDGTAFGPLLAVIREVIGKNPIIGLIHLPLSVDPNFSAYQRTMLTSAELEAFRLATKFITSSSYTADVLQNLGIDQNKIFTIIPGLDKVPQKKKYANVPTKFLSIANMCRSNDHAVLVRALAALRDKNWVLHCYGSLDQDREYVSDFQALIRKNKLQDKILVHGTISGKELSDAFLDTDLFVHPSDFETYGMALTEALAHGIPVVASTGGGIGRTVPSRMGQFFKPGDSYGLESILEELLENAEVYQKLCANAATYKESAQYWETSINLFEKAIL